MDAEEKQKLRLALASVFVAAAIVSGKPIFTGATTDVDAALALADQLLAGVKL